MAENYHTAIMRRLGMIDDLGRSQTMLTQQASPLFNAQNTLAGMPNINLPRPAPTTGDFGKFLSSISRQESGGSYGAVNSSSGALGKYQIMPSNISGTRSGWDYEALGRDVSISEFIKSPQIQEAIAQSKLKSYYDKWGPAGAAVAWYAGPGTVSGYLNNPSRYTNPQGAYPSIASYVNSILNGM